MHHWERPNLSGSFASHFLDGSLHPVPPDDLGSRPFGINLMHPGIDFAGQFRAAFIEIIEPSKRLQLVTDRCNLLPGEAAHPGRSALECAHGKRGDLVREDIAGHVLDNILIL